MSKMYRRGRGVLQRETLDDVERFILECGIVWYCVVLCGIVLYCVVLCVQNECCREKCGWFVWWQARRHCKTGSVGSAGTFDWLPDRTTSCCMSYKWPLTSHPTFPALSYVTDCMIKRL